MRACRSPPKQSQQQDDGEGNADQPKQQAASKGHDSLRSITKNQCIRTSRVPELRRLAMARLMPAGGRPAGTGRAEFAFRCYGAISEVDQARPPCSGSAPPCAVARAEAAFCSERARGRGARRSAASRPKRAARQRSKMNSPTSCSRRWRSIGPLSGPADNPGWSCSGGCCPGGLVRGDFQEPSALARIRSWQVVDLARAVTGSPSGRAVFGHLHSPRWAPFRGNPARESAFR